MHTMRRYFFTLAEVMVASTITVVLLASIAPITIGLLTNAYISSVKENLRDRINTARGWLVQDLRSAAKDAILTNPTNGIGNLQAISMLSYTRSIDTDVPVDVTGTVAKIKWNREIIYWVKTMTDGTKELHRATFSYDYTATATNAALRATRLAAAAAGSVTGTSGYVDDRAILKGITDYGITLGDNVLIDGYSATPGKETVPIGTAVLDPGSNPHRITFIARGKNTASSGYKIGVDSVIISSASLDIEAEGVTVTGDSPAVTHSSPNGVSFSNSQILEFPATAISNQFTILVNNETWEDSNFNVGKFTMVNTRENVLNSSDVLDQILQMQGDPVQDNSSSIKGLSQSWLATKATAATGVVSFTDHLEKATVRVVLPGGSLTYSGRQAKIGFLAGGSSHPLGIDSAFIVQRSGTTGFQGVGTPVQLKFSNSTSTVIPAGLTPTYSDLVMPSTWGFDRNHDYLVSYHVTDVAEGTYRASQGSYNYVEDVSQVVMDDENVPTLDHQASWPSTVDATSQNFIGLCALAVSYPDGSIVPATYQSQIIDTKVESPTFSNSQVAWTLGDTVSGVSVAVRGSNNPLLTDLGTGGWSSPCTSSGSAVTIPSGRYLQFLLSLSSAAPYSSTPLVRNVKLTWNGLSSQLVQVSADILKGPDRGMFEVQIDGQSTANPMLLYLDFSVSKTFRGKTYTDSFWLSTKPQNRTPL